MDMTDVNSTKIKINRPVASWLDYEFLMEEQKPVRSLTVILRTAGCQWRRCRMCGYWHESSAHITQADILAQLDYSLRATPKEDFILKLYTSGSFLDEREISATTRRHIARMLEQPQGKDIKIKKLVIETRPEYVSAAKIDDLLHIGHWHLEVAMGLETADDFIRLHYIDKGFSFADFKNAARLIADCGATVKTYLLLKPPFVSERSALEDVIKSADLAAPFSSVISLNLCNVQRYTPLEELWKRGYYRPPWLWSAIEAIRAIKRKRRHIVVMSDPVGAGHIRGPHNCGYCDTAVKEAIKGFNITQDLNILEGLNCDCKDRWHALMRFDEFLFGSVSVIE